MEAIKETVRGIMHGLSEKKSGPNAPSPDDLLKKVLTKKELAHIKVKYFKKGVLYIDVDSSSWLYSLSLKKEEMVVKLTQKSAVIKDIRLRIGEIR